MKTGMPLFDQVCIACSKLVTQRYSTSFSSGILAFARPYRDPVYAIYGFVRFADEIVDTFHEHDKAILLEEFRKATFKAIDHGISLNPVLHSFQQVVSQYNIDRAYIEAFLDSMAMDLDRTAYDRKNYEAYIYGSAEVVGLMCLKVFTASDSQLFDELRDAAKSLGSAFQKVNFLRDMQSDFIERGRVYFPGIDFEQFDEAQKSVIEADIRRDFSQALDGIRRLPSGVRSGVYLAYIYYLRLFEKIRKAPVHRIQKERIRIPDHQKLYLLTKSTLVNRLGLI